MSKPQLLVLWDVDHTLIENSGVSKEVYALTYEALTGTSPVHRPQTDGRTDLLIMRDLFASNGVDMTAEIQARMVPVLVEAMRAKTKELKKAGMSYRASQRH